ncbi:hypothetical protein ACQY0O_005198 [Thecaphora frezii]
MVHETLPRAPLLGPDHSSFRSLALSLFEPNLVILVAYLAFILHLALNVVRIATRTHATTTLMAPLHHPAAATLEPDQAQHHARPPRSPSHTRTTEFLVSLSSFALKNQAQNAKRITALLAAASLASTWYYMFAYLAHSYQAYVARCYLTSYPLPPPPPPLSWQQPHLVVASLHLRVLRISQWLSSLSLFEEAWMEVVRDANAWWWSSEICIVTVGSWVLFLRSEAKRLRIPHVWTFMALGQLVAISFAYNLFQLALLYRLDAEDLVPSAAWRSAVTIVPAEPPTPSRREMVRTQSEILMPPPESPSRASTTAAATTATTTTVQRIPLAPRPSLSDRLGVLMARLLPEKIAIPVLVAGGLYSVFSEPDTLGKVLVMHAFPMLLVLYPVRRVTKRKLKTSAAFGHPIATADDKAAASRFVRSKKRVPFYLDEKFLHLGLAVASVGLRLRSARAVLSGSQGDSDLPLTLAQRFWQSVQLIYPTTFHRHPAVSSIGSDHLAVLASVIAFILLESGLWIWKDAKTSPSARSPATTAAPRPEQLPASTVPASTTVTLDSIDRSRIEFQSRFVVLLAVLAPFWGASASLGFYLALRETWIEDDDQFGQQRARRRARDHGFGPHHDSEAEEPRADVAAVASESIYGRLLESDEGDRVLEIRQRKVSITTGSDASQPSQLGDDEQGHESDSLSGTEKTSPGKRTRGVPAAASTRTSARSVRKSLGSQ